MSKSQEQADTSNTKCDPPVIWHEYYQDPSHEIVLVSYDKVHFRISKFALARQR